MSDSRKSQKPESNSNTTQPVGMYRMTPNEISIGCNKFEDVLIVVANVENMAEAKRKASEFLRYVHANGHKWLK